MEVSEPEPEPEVELEPPVVLMPAPEPAPEPEPAPQAALVVLTSPEANLVAGERIPLSNGTSIGRADTNDIVLKDRFVSSHHARVIVRGDQYLLEDLGSTNGSFCNGVRVRGEVALQDKDRVGIGTSVFAFRL
ncbi:MAG: FHA domain-containing protein [Armatimonadetes bacterium]|nr:FHA domain-containing protein [Armatimonadota bacterium]MDI9584300.1 FHA domain-containing protein [Acidobacteriota bacterium]